MPRTQEENAERQFRDEINAAIGDTEREIFEDALGDDPLEMDGDRELEEMGEGLEGEHVDEETGTEPRLDTEVDEGEDENEPAEDDDSGENEGEEGERPDAAEGDEPAETEEVDAAPADTRGAVVDDRGPVRVRDQRGALRESRMRERAYRDENGDLRRELAEMRGQMSTLTQMLGGRGQPAADGGTQPGGGTRTAPAPGQPARTERAAPPPMPDQFEDPQGHSDWLLARAEERAAARFEQWRDEFQRQSTEQLYNRANVSLQQAATSHRGWEFHEAYRELTAVDRQGQPIYPEARMAILNANDPANALWDWWEDNGGPEYRQQVINSMLPEDERIEDPAPAPQRLSRHGQRTAPAPQRGRQGQQQGRHVVRVPPSLNAARGGGQRNAQRSNPTTDDGSEGAIFEFATQP